MTRADLFAPYRPYSRPEHWVHLPADVDREAPRHPIPRGEDDDERLAPILARLEQMAPVEMVRITAWVGDKPLGSKITARYWVPRCIASHPDCATHVTLHDLGDWL